MRFSLILQITLTASVTAGLLLLVKWLFREHLTAKWHYFVWILLLARLVVPPTASLWPNDGSIQNVVNVPAVTEIVSDAAAGALNHTPTAPKPVVTMGENRYETLHLGGGILPDWVYSLDRALFWVWAAGCAGLLVYFLTLSLLLYVRARRYPEAAAALHVRAAVLMERVAHGVTDRKIRVRIAPEGATPYVCGVFLPVLVLPAPMAETVDDKVLLHELLHIHRHDVLKNYIFMVFRCLNWFNPFLWFVFNRISDDCETACDACVLDLLEPAEQIDYGRRLLDMIQPHFRYRMGTSCIASGETNIRRRIVRVTRHKEISRRARGMSAVLFCLLTWMCLTAPQAQAVIWRGAGVPGDDVTAELRAAARYRVHDLNEALYLYGKAYALDNGYYRYIVADDETRDALETQFAANEARPVWLFDGEMLRQNYLATYGENIDELLDSGREYAVNPTFGVYNVLADETGGTAVIAWPFAQATVQRNGEDWSGYRGVYETVRVEKENGRFVVRRTGKETYEAIVAPELPVQPLLTYRAADKHFEYELRLTAGQAYTFYGYQSDSGSWMEQQDETLSWLGWGGGTGENLPSSPNGWGGTMLVRPKTGTAGTVGLCGYLTNTPPADDPNLPVGAFETTGASASSSSGRFSADLHVETGTQPDADGWIEMSGMLSWALSSEKSTTPLARYLHTYYMGDEADLRLSLVKIGETEVAP